VTDFYLLLGLSRDASLTEVKRAYRRLARKCHPDINPGDRIAAADFRQLAEAYETLSDPERRQRYDSGDRAEPPKESAAIGFEGFDFSLTVSGASASTFGDLFGDVLTRRTAPRDRNAPERGVDLHHTMTLSFVEAAHGGRRSLTITRQERCRACAGAGRIQTAEGRCVACHGAGHMKSARGHMVFSRPCPTCGGSGRRDASPCHGCGGRQTETRTTTIKLDFPPGLASGERVRAPAKGHAGRNGGEPGDLYVTVHVEPHPIFRREGDDLYVEVPLAVHEAALGAKLLVPALDGPARLRVPPGTQSGQQFRLREQGVPSSRTGRRGDLVVEVRLVLPRILDERSKELLREFGRINTDDVRRGLSAE
jgi:molecular chaperone DnaJ